MLYSSFPLFIACFSLHLVTLTGHVAPRTIVLGTIGEYQNIQLCYKDTSAETKLSTLIIDGTKDEGSLRLKFKHPGDCFISSDGKITHYTDFIDVLQTQSMAFQKNEYDLFGDEKVQFISTVIRVLKQQNFITKKI